MPRRPAAMAAAGLALAAALAVLPGGASATSPGPAPAAKPAIATVKSDRLTGRTLFEKRLFEARRDSVDLDPFQGPAERPNIVVVMTDDMRDDDLRFMPNVQRLIGDQGVRFTNMFSPQPLCCPARASFLTGKYSHNHGVWSHVSPYGWQSLEDKQTLPVWLHDLGYDTAFLGKYLNGYGSQRLPNGDLSLRYVPPGWTDWRGSVEGKAGGLEEHLMGGTYRYFDSTLNVNGTLEPHEGVYQTNLYSRIAQEQFRTLARSPRPFFSWVSFTAPHKGLPREEDDPEPIQLADGSMQKFQNPARPPSVRGRFDQLISRIPGADDAADDVSLKPFFVRARSKTSAPEMEALLEDYRQRVESLSVVDDEVANLMATLERTGELDNTYVVFTSDNGFFVGEHRQRHGKVLPYEASLRVPLMIRGPGIPRGETRTDPFLMTDFAPTLVEAAGGAPPTTVDGESLLDVARNGDRGWTRGILTDTGPRVISQDIRESDNFLVSGGEPFRLRFSTGVRTGRYLYVEHATGDRELYDLRTDPRQFANLVDRPRMRRVVRLLSRELERLENCVTDECRRPLHPALRTSDPAPAYVPDPVARPTRP